MQVRAGYKRTTGDGRELRTLRRELAGVKREKRGEGSVIKGLSAVYYREGDAGTEYWLWRDMVERIMPGAFDRAISEKHDARGLFNHDSSQLLGRVSSGSLTLSLTSEGLAYEIPVDAADPDHQRVGAKIDRGDVTGSSFAFLVRAQTWSEVKLDDGSWLYIRQITDLDLFDVGPVTFPAYEATTAGRSTDAAGQLREALTPEIRQLIAERERALRGGEDDSIAMRKRLMEIE